MAKFIIKSFIVIFLIILVVTYLSDQEIQSNPEVKSNDQTIILSSSDLYQDFAEEVTLENHFNARESLTYQIAQIVEQSGLLIYEGIITVISDLAKIM